MPIYKDMECSTPKTFRIRCEALGYSAIGEGSQKKSAKHQAAEKVIKMFLSEGAASPDDDEDDDSTDAGFEPSSSDWISDLIQFCMERAYPKPTYNVIKQLGPSHAPEFTIRCQVGSVCQDADEKNKKMARQMAAHKMLKGLQMVSSYY